MQINSVEYGITYGYKSNTKLSLSWYQLEGGVYRARDRSSTNDKYFADVTFKGGEEIYNLDQYLGTVSDSAFDIALSTHERIFGAEVQNTSPSVKLASKGVVNRINKAQYTMNVTLYLVSSPIIDSNASSFDWSNPFPLRYEAGRQLLDYKSMSFDGTYYLDSRTFDNSTHKVNLRLKNSEMRDLRYTLINELRGGEITIPSGHEWFGNNVNFTKARVIDFDAGSKVDFSFWDASITFVNGDT